MKFRAGLAALAATSLLLAACGDDPDDSGGDAGSLKETEETQEVLAPRSSPAVVPEPTTLWIQSPDTSEIYRVDVGSNKVAAEVPVDGYVVQTDFHDGALWFATDSLYRLDPATNAIERRSPSGQEVGAFTWAGDRLWAAEGDEGASVFEIDPQTGDVLQTIEVPGEDVDPENLIPLDDHMIAVNTYDHSIMNIDLGTGEFESVEDHDSIVWDLALVDDALYASTYDTFQVMDPETLEVTKLVDEEAAFASDVDEDGVVWVGRSGDLGRFDPETGQYQTVIAEVPGAEGGRVNDLKVSEKSVWIVFDSHVVVRHDRESGQFDPPIPLPAGASAIPVYGLSLQ